MCTEPQHVDSQDVFAVLGLRSLYFALAANDREVPFSRGLVGDGPSDRRAEDANRVRDVLFCATEGLECQLIHEWLLGWVKSVGVSQARWADRLRQDLVQPFTSARLEFELAAREIARGGSTDDVVEKIRAELRRFRRLADTWRDLVEHHHRGDEELWLDDITSNVFDLLATEARLARVEFTFFELPRFRVLACPALPE